MLLWRKTDYFLWKYDFKKVKSGVNPIKSQTLETGSIILLSWSHSRYPDAPFGFCHNAVIATDGLRQA